MNGRGAGKQLDAAPLEREDATSAQRQQSHARPKRGQRTVAGFLWNKRDQIDHTHCRREVFEEMEFIAGGKCRTVWQIGSYKDILAARGKSSSGANSDGAAASILAQESE